MELVKLTSEGAAFGQLQTTMLRAMSKVMKAVGIPSQLSNEDEKIRFKTVIIYEDLNAGRRAKAFSDQLSGEIEEVEEDFDFTRNIWSFNVLAIPEIRNIAATAAAAADVVILSASGKECLPPEVVEWLEMWAWLIDQGAPAMVALFDHPNSECAVAMRSQLQRITARKHLDYFPNCDFPPHAEHPNNRTQRGGFATSTRAIQGG